MQIPEYVTEEDARSICDQLGLRDWTAMAEAQVSIEEARVILERFDLKGMTIPLEDFRRGLVVELEHGKCFPDANVTNNHPILTGKIVLAHFKETPDYYRLLNVAEAEGDLQKAIQAGDMAKVQKYYKNLLESRLELDRAELARLK